MGFLRHEVLILNWGLGTVWPWDKKVNGNTMATPGDPTLSYPNLALTYLNLTLLHRTLPTLYYNLTYLP
jgi:hypothetical protein